MENKNRKLLAALVKNEGKQDEATVGASIGLTEEETEQALTELTNEGKLEFHSFGICSYVPTGR